MRSAFNSRCRIRTATRTLAAAFAVVAGLHAGGCKRTTAPAAPDAVARLTEALRPDVLVNRLRNAGGAHVTATTRFRVAVDGTPNAGFVPPQDITTATELWLDKAGHFRLIETNDHDGGREMIATDESLVVGLRHGKLIRQPRDDRAAARALTEAAGGPWAGWEIARAAASVTSTGDPAGEHLVIALATAANSTPAGDSTPTPLRGWRGGVTVEDLKGDVVLGGSTVRSARLSGRFRAKQGSQPVAGSFDVTFTAALENPTIENPDAGELPVVQRTILEERALLSDLPGRRDPNKIAGAAPTHPAAPR